MWKKLIHLLVLGLGVYAWQRVDLYAPSMLVSVLLPVVVMAAAVYTFAMVYGWLVTRSGMGRGGSVNRHGVDSGDSCWGASDGSCDGDGGGSCD